MNFYAASRSPSFYRMNSLALKPCSKVFFQDQHHFPRLVGCEIAFLDGTVDRVIAAFCQFSRLVYCHGIVSDHYKKKRLQNIEIQVSLKKSLFNVPILIWARGPLFLIKQ